jgi:probable phosphoglycerate mutase
MTVHPSQDNSVGERSGVRVVLVRAGETEFTRAGRFQGDVDIPLTERGREQTRSVTEDVLDATGCVDAVYCAANQSARETAEIVASANSNRIRILPDLRGVSFGLWEGQLVTEVRHRHTRIFDTWRREPTSIAPPQGEEIEDAYSRAGSAVRSILKKHKDGAVAVVAPDAMIALLYCRLAELPANEVFQVEERLGRMEVVSSAVSG